MKPARFYLACVALVLLAACGRDPLAPTIDSSPRFDEQPSDSSDGTGTTTTECAGTWTTVTRADGSVSVECRQFGSGA